MHIIDFITGLFRAPAPPPLLKKGSRGPAVADLKRTLNYRMGAGLYVDDKFDNKTEAAVKAAQKKHGLIVDGIVGPHTRKALR